MWRSRIIFGALVENMFLLLLRIISGYLWMCAVLYSSTNEHEQLLHRPNYVNANHRPMIADVCTKALCDTADAAIPSLVDGFIKGT